MRKECADLLSAAQLGIFFIVCCASSCGHQSAKDVLRGLLLEAAGPNAIDCGRTPVDERQRRVAQRNCVFDAHRNRQAFIVMYEIAGKEGEIYEYGLAGDTGGRGYRLDVPSVDNYKDLYEQYRKAGNRLTPTACPTPILLEVLGHGAVSCVWNQRGSSAAPKAQQ